MRALRDGGGTARKNGGSRTRRARRGSALPNARPTEVREALCVGSERAARPRAAAPSSRLSFCFARCFGGSGGTENRSSAIRPVVPLSLKRPASAAFRHLRTRADASAAARHTQTPGASRGGEKVALGNTTRTMTGASAGHLAVSRGPPPRAPVSASASFSGAPAHRRSSPPLTPSLPPPASPSAAPPEPTQLLP